MAEGKQYFTVKDVFDAAVKLAKADPYFEQYNKICVLDYDLILKDCEDGTLYRAEFAYWVMCPMVEAKESTVTSTCMVAGAKIRMISAAIVHASMYSKRSTAIRSRIWRSACWSISSATTQTSLSQSTWIILIKEELHHA